MLTTERARVFAEDWFAAWNAHDLQAVLSHYTDDVRFTSPFAIHGDETFTMCGKKQVTKHVQRAFERVPDLHFEPIETLVSAASVVLCYRGVFGLMVAEFMGLNSDGLADRVIAHYNRLPASAAIEA